MHDNYADFPQDKIGLLLEHDLRYLFTIWQMLVNGQMPVVLLGTRTATIK